MGTKERKHHSEIEFDREYRVLESTIMEKVANVINGLENGKRAG